MNPLKAIRGIFLPVLAAAGLLFFLNVAAAESYQLSGRLTTVDPGYRTVVVQVPMADDKTFTVAGPLTDNAILRREGRTVKLNEFEVYDWVTVEWESTGEGHKIIRLISK